MPTSIDSLPEELLPGIFKLCSSARTVHHRHSMSDVSNHPVPVSIFALPEELLIIILDLSFATSKSVHTRATLSLVCRHWKNIIYSTPALWTTLRTSVACHRALLGLANSQDMPLNVDMDVPSIENDRHMGALEEITKHLHRWRSATICIPFDQRLFKAFSRPAPLLEHLSIKPWGVRDRFHFDPFKGHAPRLRSICLSRVDLPWSTEMLSGLEAIELTYISEGPSAKQFISILKSSPRLSILKLYALHFTTLFDFDSASPIHLPLLQVFTIGGVDASLVTHLLCRIASPPCPTISVNCRVNLANVQLTKSMFAIIHDLLPNSIQAELELPRYGDIYYSLHGTPNQTISIVLEGSQTRALLHRLIHDSLPPRFLTLDTKLTLVVDDDTEALEQVCLETSGEMHITSLMISGAAGGILNRLATPTGGRWLFPYLQSVSISLEDVSPGALAKMVKARHSFGESEVPLPLPFTSLSVFCASEDHALDLGLIENIIASEGLTWKTGYADWE